MCINSLRISCLLLCLLVSACQSTPELPSDPPLLTGTRPDFSGHWEKDYARSDDFNDRLQLYVADIRRQFSRQGTLNQSPGFISNEAINGLARFAEEITRMPLLVIEHGDSNIEVDREHDFTLRCHYRDRQFVSSNSPFGADICGWNDQRLVFRMELGGGLTISHQFSLSPDGASLDVTTTVSSDSVSAPLVVRNIYQRFEAPEEDYNCMLTLTRSTVCTRGGTPQ